MLEDKGVLLCEKFTCKEFPDENIEAPLSKPFLIRRMELLSNPVGFILCIKMGVDLFSTSELLYPKMKVKTRLIGAPPKFDKIADNSNVSLGFVDCSLYTRCIAHKNQYHKKRKNMLACTRLEYNYFKMLATTFIIPAIQNQFVYENIFNKIWGRRIGIAINTNSAFTGSFSKKIFLV